MFLLRLKQTFISSILLLMPTVMFAAEATLSIELPANNITKRYTTSELLKQAEPQPLIVKNDPAYPGKSMTYTVIPVTTLFANLPIQADSIIAFKALDGFSSELDAQRLLNRSSEHALAYIAIETPQTPWPPLKKDSAATAGPFYLIWKNPTLSNIGSEQWPYQLIGFTIKPSLRSAYPGITPAASIPANSEIMRGFKVFAKNCFSCHTLNRNGDSKVGPDLNYPHNPTEYLAPAYLKMLIRNPQNLRHWPESRMTGFPESAISNSELDDLIAYLKQMQQQRVAPQH